MEKRAINKSNTSFIEIKGNSIKECWRYLTESEFEDIPKDLKGEESDGFTYLILSNGIVLSFYPNTEEYTLDYSFISLEDIPDKALNFSSSSYWKERLGSKIIEIKILRGKSEAPFGVQLELENSSKIELQYVSETEYTFDALVVR